MNRNPQIDLAERYVNETGISLFLTGKAGTGKTTFLRHIDAHCHKRHVVVAPTGVAAVNAGGVTIHSFFQLPFCPYLPDIPELVTEYQMPEQQRQLRKSKIDIIRTLDLLIIDEISMVRADRLDAIDATLRRYRRNSRPFGGVQLLLIGDVQQLAPVVTEEERPFMERVYPSPFFFHSKALQRLHYITIQLTTIYRQQDSAFVQLLNNIRDNRFDEASTTTGRDAYYSYVFGRVAESKAAGDNLLGVNFWAWGGFAAHPEGHVDWQKGDDYSGDPAQEAQGLNSVYVHDTSTLSVIAGAGLVIGSFVSGGTATPNFTRFAKNGRVGLWTTVFAFFIGKNDDHFAVGNAHRADGQAVLFDLFGRQAG